MDRREFCGPTWVKEGYSRPWHPPDAIIVEVPRELRERAVASPYSVGEEQHKSRLRQLADFLKGMISH
jgi:hypothetical protein